MSFVCGTDFGESATRAAEIAARLAAKAKRSLALVHSLELPSLAYVAGEPLLLAAPPAVSKEEMRKDADVMLAREATRLAVLSGASVVPRLTIGSPAEAILETAADLKPDLIVTGTHGRSAPARWLFGSTADRLVRRASDPVLVVREPSAGLAAWSHGERPLRVLVGVAFDDSFDYAALAVRDLASWGPCETSFAHAHGRAATLYGGAAWPLAPLTAGDLEATTARVVTTLAKRRGLSVTKGRVRLLAGAPAPALVEEAEHGKFDLIVVGTHGRTGLERAMLGSVALGVLHHAPCPVLVAPLI